MYMRNRSLLCASLLTVASLIFNGCGAPHGLDFITISPANQSLVVGQTSQYTAIGTFGNAKHTSTQTVTSGLTWSSNTTSVATIDANGVVSAVGAGTTTITATAQAFNGPSTASATLTVTAPAGSGGGIGGEQLLSMIVLPGSITTNNLLGTGQFLAYGTFSTPPLVQDVTNGINHNGYVAPVKWISDAPYIFPVSSYGATGTTGSTGGLATAVGTGGANIYVVAANPDGTVVYSPSVSFNCPYVPYNPGDPTATPPVQPTLGSCNDHTIASGLLVTLTVWNAGLNTSNWLLTAPSATGTPNVINCGPGVAAGATSVCTASYPLGTTVIITAPAQSGVQFGGWSYNCTPTMPVTAAGPNQCKVVLGTDPSTSNDSVGAIFN
jgi:hypothetical protein